VRHTGIAVTFSTLLLSWSPSAAETEETPDETERMVEGLWSYRTIASRGQEAGPITGLFLFYDGHFVQQAIGDLEPWQQQLGQAHAGTYRITGDGIDLTAELGIIVAPGQTHPLSLSRNGPHQVAPKRAGEELTLTFGSGTVQTFEKIGSGPAEIYSLGKGYLVISNGHFLFVTVTDNGALAGSGAFEKTETSMLLRAWRWFSVDGDRVSYLRDQVLKATFDGETFALEEGPTFRVEH
jgi:hypothetical protein